MMALSFRDRVRLVATDLDGTLLREDGSVSERTRRALRRVREAGIVVVLVSARPPRILRIMAREIGVMGLAICSNGALVYDLEREEISAHAPLRSEVARGIVADLREAVPGVCFAVEAGMRPGWEAEYLTRRPDARVAGGTEADALSLCAGPVTKLIALHDKVPADELLRIIEPLVMEAAHATHSGGPYVEISAAGVHKAGALERLCCRLGIASEEVVAFGDMPNDLPMLAWAGHSVSVANAHPDVLEACDETTLANRDDGVAVVLDRLIRYGAHDHV